MQATTAFLEDGGPEKHRAGQRYQPEQRAQEVIPAIHECVLQSDVKDRSVLLQAHTPAHTFAPAFLLPANDETRMTNDKTMTKSELPNKHLLRFVTRAI